MKKFAIIAALLLAPWAVAGAIHSWSTGEYITATDLNAALTHIHNTMVGGHGPRLINADVSTSAAIAHSKLATPGLVAKAWVALSATCVTSGAGAACTAVDSSGTAVVTSTGATDGEYTVTYPTRGDVNVGAVVSAFGALDLQCHITSFPSATTASVKCATASTGVAADGAFTFMLLDSSN